MKKKLQYINLLRIVATFAIIAVHVGALYRSTGALEYPDGGYVLYDISCRLQKFAVPTFVFISGALLLGPGKSITWHDIFQKYMARIVRVLLIFGFAMCLASAYTERSADQTVLQVLLIAAGNLLTGHCWHHMWYMYMLLGLYALTPLYKSFISTAAPRDAAVFLSLMALMCVLLPFLKNVGILPLQHYITLPVFLFLYPFGYYLNAYVRPTRLTVLIAISLLVLFLVRAVYHAYSGIAPYNGYDLFAVGAAVGLFHVSKLLISEQCVWMDSLSKHCFCIYIVHAAVLQVLFKVLHVGQHVSIHPLLNVLFVSAIAFLLSWCISLVLHKIPYLNKKVL